jgi:hypothetical protein
MRRLLLAVAVPLLGCLVAAVTLMGCSTYGDDLARGQMAFEQNNHERALALFRALDRETEHLNVEENARYAYLRGMTDYRIGYRSEARHWLLVAHAIEGESPGSLPMDWKARLTEALGELNEQVFREGTASLTNARRAPGEEPKAPPPKKKSEDEP